MLHFDTKYSIYNARGKNLGKDMQADKENIRKLLWNQYNSGVKATEAVRNINRGSAPETINNRMAQRWFKDFRQGRQSTGQLLY